MNLSHGRLLHVGREKCLEKIFGRFGVRICTIASKLLDLKERECAAECSCHVGFPIHSRLFTFWRLIFEQADFVILVNAGFCFENKTGSSEEGSCARQNA